MYPNAPTDTEEFIRLIEANSPDVKDIIKEYIDAHNTSEMLQGVNYYFSKSDITKRNIYVYDEAGNKIIDQDATNNKLPSGWHKLLVDQKTAYLVGDPVTVGSKSDKDIEPVTETMGEEFDDALPELVKNASNKGREWLHPFIDEEGNFDYIIIPAEQVIPIYDNSKRKNLDAAIRYYTLDDGEVTKIELWDHEQVTYYEMIGNGEIYLDVSEDVNPAPHFFYGENGYGWNKVPFIEFKNNEECVSDLVFYKAYVDMYDKIMSDEGNTLEDMQSFIYVLKGYEGTDLKQFITDLKRYKVISMSDEQGAGVDTINSEVPVEATNSYLDRLIQNIYAFGQGVNTNTDKFGNNPTGVALKFLYSLLDMKSNVSERKFAKALEKFVWFVCEYLSISGQGDFDYKDITFTFNKSMIMNETELLDNLMKSSASTETKLEHDPFVSDVEQEKDRLQKEQDEYMRNMPDVSDDESRTD
jgi:SPP1 family phage portal protein